MKLRLTALVIVVLLSSHIGISADTLLPQHQQRYQTIIHKLRCLVCQNQTIADSDADLAKDLRDQVKKMLNESASDEEILSFMYERYGDFVLYDPPLKLKNYILWFGPFLLLVTAIFIILIKIRRNAKKDTFALNEEEQNTLNRILKSTNKDD